METEGEVRMKRLFAATVLLFFLQGSSQIISAQTSEVESLRGLRGMAVIIEDFQSITKKTGLTESQLKIDVEVELRKAGILVLTRDKIMTTPGNPYLYVTVYSNDRPGVVVASGLYAFGIDLALRQAVDLRRNRSIGLWATTWGKGSVGSTGISNFKKGVREAVRDHVNDFINDYLTANPK